MVGIFGKDNIGFKSKAVHLNGTIGKEVFKVSKVACFILHINSVILSSLQASSFPNIFFLCWKEVNRLFQNNMKFVHTFNFGQKNEKSVVTHIYSYYFSHFCPLWCYFLFYNYNIIYFCCQIDFLDSMFKKKDMHDFSVSMLKFVTVMFCFAVEHVFFFVFCFFFTWACLFSFGSSLFFV